MIQPGLYAQKISGKVLNERGQPASYVTVRFKDKSTAVYSNDDGSFNITANNLPDTLFFSAPGFEPYKVLVTTETTRDSHFEVVLLNTRRKIKASDVSENMITGGRNNMPSNGNSNQSGQGGSPGAGSYIAGKKLYLIDTIASNGSMMYRSGLLSAGEVNDFNRKKMWEDFTEKDFKDFSSHWGLYPVKRYCVQVENKEHNAMISQPVFLIDKKTNDTVWSAITDNTGKAELWASMKDSARGADFFISCSGAGDITSPTLFTNGINRIELNAPCSVSNTVDIAVVVDATGSMTNEIDFLKIELEEVLRNTFTEYQTLDLHVGSVFYRDRGDEYLTRHVDMQPNLLKVLNFIKLQRASGGGDVPEAVHAALQTSLDSLQWSDTARTRILFLVTDAPPHDETKDKLFQLIQRAAAKGIRIVPVICKGADKSTEFIMRSMALATNGTYVFLTDDNAAQFVTKPAVGVFDVQFLNAMLERIIRQMVIANDCEAQNETRMPKNIPANIDSVRVTLGAAQGTVTIESKQHLKEVFISDFTGKILVHLETKEKQTRWIADVKSYPNATYLVKYITADDQWGAEKFELMHE